MASSEALLWQDMGKMMTRTRCFIYRMMLQPFVPILKIVQEIFQRLMWLLPYFAGGEVKKEPEYLLKRRTWFLVHWEMSRPKLG